jgi:hypothetical protein
MGASSGMAIPSSAATLLEIVVNEAPVSNR